MNLLKKIITDCFRFWPFWRIDSNRLVLLCEIRHSQRQSVKRRTATNPNASIYTGWQAYQPIW